jgi:predicted transposase YdaD
MADEVLAFDQWVEEMGWAAKWRAEGEARGEERGEARGEARGKKKAWEEAIAFLKQGHTVEELERMIPSTSNNN